MNVGEFFNRITALLGSAEQHAAKVAALTGERDKAISDLSAVSSDRDRLSAEVGKALDNPKLLQRLEAQGLTVQKSTPAQSDKYIASEYEKWGRVVRESNISTD